MGRSTQENIWTGIKIVILYLSQHEFVACLISRNSHWNKTSAQTFQTITYNTIILARHAIKFLDLNFLYISKVLAFYIIFCPAIKLWTNGEGTDFPFEYLLDSCLNFLRNLNEILHMGIICVYFKQNKKIWEKYFFPSFSTLFHVLLYWHLS